MGISPDQIDRLLARLFPGKSPAKGSWSIKVLAAHSTGFRGMNRSISDIFAADQLKKVGKLIYYDCLYRHDAPNPPGENTFHAMEKLIANSPQAKFIIYELTGNTGDSPIGGTPRRAANQYWTKFPANADPFQPKTNTVTEVINFKTGLIQALQALACARLIDAGLEDGFLNRDFIAGRFKTNGELLLKIIDEQLKPRGSYASTAALAAAAKKTFVGNWLSPPSDIPKLVTLLETMREPVIMKFKLLGWEPSNIGDLVHDSHVPEFGWEHLLG